MVKFLDWLGEELSQYVRHSAWLSAVPNKPDNDKSKVKNKPRRESLNPDEVLDMPPCSAFYMVKYLFEIGPTMGDSAITHGEIESWQRNMGIELNAWESRTLRILSIHYLNESIDAKQPDRADPWDESKIKIALPSLASQELKNSMRALSEL